MKYARVRKYNFLKLAELVHDAGTVEAYLWIDQTRPGTSIIIPGDELTTEGECTPEGGALVFSLAETLEKAIKKACKTTRVVREWPYPDGVPVYKLTPAYNRGAERSFGGRNFIIPQYHVAVTGTLIPTDERDKVVLEAIVKSIKDHLADQAIIQGDFFS